jgi:fatty-acyl-CoA synthase
MPDAAFREQMKTNVAGLLRARHGLESRVVLAVRSLPQTSSGKLSRAWSLHGT